MPAFRLLLVVMALCLASYTAVVMAHHGANLLPVFFGDMLAMRWPGQFNLDFLFMLTLSGLWVSWRHHFSSPGLGLGLLAFFGGAMFLTLYLLVIIAQAKGNMRMVLLGPIRANA